MEGSEVDVSSLQLEEAAAPSSAAQSAATLLTKPWDPLDPTFCALPPRPMAIGRIKSDVLNAIKDPLPGIMVLPDEDNILTVHALISGPQDTPYDSGFFYFLLRFPPDYPLAPPRVRLWTTDNVELHLLLFLTVPMQDRVRFNPNLYRSGKVCLSILGTWAGPEWRASQTLTTILLSIQSLMSEKPYHNEPGFNLERSSGHVQKYNEIIVHEVALFLSSLQLILVDDSRGGDRHGRGHRLLRPGAIAFHEAHPRLFLHTGQAMADPFGEARGKFRFQALKQRLLALQATVESHVDTDEEEEEEDGIGL